MAFREPPLVKRTKAVLEACDQVRDIDLSEQECE